MAQPQLEIGLTAVPWHDAPLRAQAQRLANQLSLPVAAESPVGYAWLLVVTHNGLEIHHNTNPRSRPIRANWAKLDTTSRAGRNHNQLIAKAIGLRKTPAGSTLHIADATAGLGNDTWLLASLGCRVTAIERSPLIAALLHDGLQRAKIEHPEIANRITVVADDAHTALPSLTPAPDVVYLDPMFPPKRKAALPPLPVRVLRAIVGDDPDAAALLSAARQTARHRVVVKRPLHAPPLWGQPVATHRGKSLRYNVYHPSPPNRRSQLEYVVP